jgi:NAD(P)-dependent dehydrogenase (short-subunit alcohol dehydrogenase family)
VTTGTLLAGKRVLVTGAGAGLGRGIALACAADGADVIVTSLSENGVHVAQEIEAQGGRASWIACDVTDRKQVATAILRSAAGDGLHGVVHNAITRGTNSATPLEGWDAARWESEIAVALRGAFYVASACAATLATTGGAMVLMSSAAAVEGSATNTIYAVVKAATRGLARGLTAEWGPHGVRVNTVVPLAVSPTVERTFASDPALRDRMTALTSLRRLGDPVADVGPAVAFLLSDHASYITGQTIAIDGGRLVHL